MNMKKNVLVFDIWGDFAHFKRIETTTSPLTYPFPAGTTLSGIVAAMIGMERDSYYNMFSHQDFLFGISILKPIRKARINLNFLNTKFGYRIWDITEKGKSPYTQIPLELVREPKYRIYLHMGTSLNDIKEKLKKNLTNHQTVYTLYLGISELIANFEFIGEFESEYIRSEEKEEIHTVMTLDNRIVIESGKRYGRETIPLYMDSNRKVIEYGEVIYEMNANPLRMREGWFYDVNGEHVVFL
jgi:CRISPR-associated protein Cas5h